MTLFEFWEALIKYTEYTMYLIMKNLGIQPSEVLAMDVSYGQQCIDWFTKEAHDLRMMDKIDFFGAHGIDVRKPSVIGTDIYDKWIREKQKERFDALEKQMADRVNREIKIAPEIDKIITEKRIKAKYGK
jgi:hypothetical protein